MDSIILKDGTEIIVEEGANTNSIIVILNGYDDLQALSNNLTDKNLDYVKFKVNGNEARAYEKMALKSPNFCVTQGKDGKLQVVFGIRKKTQEELQQDSIQTAITYLTDEQALTVSALYPDWSEKKNYKAGDRYCYDGILYKCLQDHNGQSDWNPDAATSLWARVLIENTEGIPEWEQPDSTNGYTAGDKVTHNGKTYESLIDNNVWEPGAIGTESLWKEIG